MQFYKNRNALGRGISEKMPPEEIINQRKQLLTMSTPTSLQLKCYGRYKNKVLRRKKKKKKPAIFSPLFYSVENCFLIRRSYVSFGKDSIKLLVRSPKYSGIIRMTNVKNFVFI